MSQHDAAIEIKERIHRKREKIEHQKLVATAWLISLSLIISLVELCRMRALQSKGRKSERMGERIILRRS